MSATWGILLAAWLATWVISWPTRRRRQRVIAALHSGPRASRDIPLCPGLRGLVLLRMQIDGMIERARLPDGRRVYQLAIADLLRRARLAVEAMTPDELVHHRHEQRISFAYGNVALSQTDPDESVLRESVRRAAGPCPCGQCKAM